MAGEDRRGEMLIQREERKLESAKAKAKAYEKNMTETIAAIFKNKDAVRKIAVDAMSLVSGNTKQDDIFKKANSGLYSDDQEIITGNEPRPWESD